MGDSFEESGIFDESLSKWQGVKQNKDGTFSYEDGGYEPIPFDFFTASSIGETEIIQDLLERKEVRANALNQCGWSALMYAAYMGHAHTVQCLLDAGADSNQKSPKGYTSLILASMCGNEVCMHAILQKGAEIDAVDERGWNALLHTASAGHYQSTEFLIKCGANCEIVEPSQGLTPLMEAAASGHEPIVDLLLQKGVDAMKQDFNGETALTLAKAYHHNGIADAIEKYHASRQMAALNLGKGSSRNYNSNNNGQAANKSGPSIHAGPKGFAQMTGIGSDGKPHPHANVPTFMQSNPSLQPEPSRHQKWEGPKDLEEVLVSIDCKKYLNTFLKQEIDLNIFLTLTELDLKEIGISLFGPRRKMVSVIERLVNGIQTNIADRTEHVYSDIVHSKLHRVKSKLKECEDEKEMIKAQVAKERELRAVTEGVLMEHKDMWLSLGRLSEKWAASQHRLAQTSEQARIHTFSQLSDKAHSSIRNSNNSRNDKNERITKSFQDMDTLVHHQRDYLLKMQNLLQRVASAPIHSGNKKSTSN